MKGNQPIVGLPKAFINLQKKAILDVGSRKKWTFSFDNRVTTADLNDDEIEELKKNPPPKHARPPFPNYHKK
jgi:hypothetical protein